MLTSYPARLRGLLARFLEGEITRRLVKNSGYLFSATGISAALSFLQNILIVRMLAPGDFGVLGAILMFTSVINKFASFRMSELVIKYVGEYSVAGDRQRAAAIFKGAALTEVLASLVAFGLIVALAPLGASYFAKDSGLAPWFVTYGLIVLANLIAESSTGLLQIFNRYRQIASTSIAQSVFVLLAVGVAYLAHGGLLVILLAYLGGKVVGALGLTIAALVEATRRWGRDWWRSPLGLLRPRWGELSRFAISTNISASLSLINKDSELLWVSFFRNPVETGFYKFALGIANLVQMPVSPLPQATYPELSREVAQKNWHNVRSILRKGSLIAGSYTLAASLVLAIFGKLVIRYIFNPVYLPAYPALLILLAGFLVANTFYWNRTALLALGLPDFPTKVNLALAVAKVVGILLLVPKYGYLASAALLAGAYIAGVSVSVLKVYATLSRLEKAQAPDLAQAKP